MLTLLKTNEVRSPAKTVKPLRGPRIRHKSSDNLFVEGLDCKKYDKKKAVELRNLYLSIKTKDKNSDNYSEMVGKLCNLKKYGHMVEYLADSGPGPIEFAEFLKAACPGLGASDLNAMLKWANFDGELFKEETKKPQKMSSGLQRNADRALTYYQGIFERADENHDGVLSLEELKAKFKTAVAPDALEKLFNIYHADHEGALTFKEFAMMMAPKDIESLIEKMAGDYESI